MTHEIFIKDKDSENMSLELKNISLTLGDVSILTGFNLSVPKGQTISLVGSSGSGKSSLLMLMGLMEKPTSGTIHFNNELVSGFNEDQAAKWRSRNLGIVFQSFHLIETLSALDNVALPLELAGIRDAKSQARAELEAVGLTHRLNHKPTEMSGGEQQRVALARAFVARPSLILADEPTGNLDENTGKAIVELIFKRQAETGATLVLVTHDEALAHKTQRLIRLKSGVIVEDSAS
jgi:putative ABC transport system ATP-binding protein